jgi:hypothetical protein
MVRINVLGSGRQVIGAARGADLTRADVESLLLDGFLPVTDPDAAPQRDLPGALRELGLPYAADPAITRHLAWFLHQAARQMGEASRPGLRPGPRLGRSRGPLCPAPLPRRRARARLAPDAARALETSTESSQRAATRAGTLAQPSAVLFNGGFFTPAIARTRVQAVLAGWFGPDVAPRQLANDRPEAAVALGAGYFGLVRRAGGIRIAAGSPRSYYIGASSAPGVARAVCVLRRGTEEGTRIDLADRAFHAVANRLVAFTLYSSPVRRDEPGTVVAVPADGGDFHRHAPLVTALRFGKRSRAVDVDVRLAGQYTELGTLDLWCESIATDHRWRLRFALRASDLETAVTDDREPESGSLVSDEAAGSAGAAIDGVFGSGTDDPDALPARLEAVLGFGRSAWSLALLRSLGDRLLEQSAGRTRTARHEARWLNLTGFCLRPGFGAPGDEWRTTQIRKVYLAGLAHDRDVQALVEWMIVWQRVSGGFSAGQQREMFQRVAPTLPIGRGTRPPRLNAQVERESWRLLAGLERLPSATRVEIGDAVLARIGRTSGNPALIWAIGRLGARLPLYGPITSVVPPHVAERWMAALLSSRQMTVDVAAAVVQIGARTDDPARDVGDEARDAAAKALLLAGIAESALAPLLEYRPPKAEDSARSFGEPLPEGLRLAST